MRLDDLKQDIAVDTCVLAHACQARFVYAESAVALLDRIRVREDLMWVLDDNGKAAPAVETSLLWAEYNQTLGPQSFPLILVASLLRSGRVFFARRPGQSLRGSIRRLVPGNQRDQVVLGAAAGSSDKVLATNDFDDFPDSVRAEIRSQLGIAIQASYEL
jgi:hypothetical protein